MTRRRAVRIGVVVAALLAVTAVAHADDPGDARLRAATLRAAADPAGAIAAYLAIADELPDSMWADDALVEAARLLERTGDKPRAAAVLARLADRYPDSRQAAWARGHAAALIAETGGGAWTAVAAEHDALVAAAGRPGDPHPQLVRLGALLRASPGYPRGASARTWLGDAWSKQGEWGTALGWYRDAAAVATTGGDRRSAQLGSVAALIALDRFTDAGAALAEVRADPAADPIAITRAAEAIGSGRRRHRWQLAAWAALAVLAAAALIVLVRARGSIRAAARALARPPIEVLYLAPVAAIVALASSTGNALIASAVRWIAIGGVGVTWSSGVVGRATRGTPGRGRIAIHVAAVALAVAAIVYLAVSRDGLLDLLVETWRTGPEVR